MTYSRGTLSITTLDKLEENEKLLDSRLRGRYLHFRISTCVLTSVTEIGLSRRRNCDPRCWILWIYKNVKPGGAHTFCLTLAIRCHPFHPVLCPITCVWQKHNFQEGLKAANNSELASSLGSVPQMSAFLHSEFVWLQFPTICSGYSFPH